MMTYILALLLGVAANARPLPAQKGLLEVRPGRKLFVDHRPARNGKPTLFLLNGLTYSTREWNAFVGAMQELDPDIGFVLYDMRGMGQTLLNDGPAFAPIALDEQVEDLHALKSVLGVQGPTASVGLSYGGALALAAAIHYPDDFDQVVAMAPFLERIPEQDRMIKTWVSQHRVLYPLDPRSEDQLYDHYLRVMIYSSYPMVEPIIMENPLKLEAVFRMVQGAKNWNAAASAPDLPKGKVHVVGARADEYVKFDRLQYFLSAVLPGTLASTMFIQDPPLELLLPTQKHHKIPELRPRLIAAWVRAIVSGDSSLQKGLTFWADPLIGEARSGSIVIPLEKAVGCASSLGKSFWPSRI